MGMIARELAMVVYLIVGVIVGALLAQRYKVLVLVPAGAVATALAVVVGVRRGGAGWEIFCFALFDIAALQIGYLAGSGIQVLAHSSHAISGRHRSVGASMSSRRAAH